MKVKDLKKYLKNFKDEDIVAVSMWDNKGGHYFVPNIPVCDPIKFKSTHKENIAVVGCYDYALAYMVDRLKK